MITFTSAELYSWIAGLLWPLTRILGLIAVAPLYGNVSVPASVKVGLAILIALIVAPVVPSLPALDPMSMGGLLIMVQQFVIGTAMGFAMRVTFSAIEMAGEISSLTMGLGFATFFDPQSQGRSSAVSQFMALLAISVFLAANVHLLLISTLVDSFNTLPIVAMPWGTGGFQQLAIWAGRIFSAGVQLSLPIVAALLIVNIALGVLTRAAPQLNIFGIGFPITLSIGLILLALVLPYLGIPMQRLLHEGIEAMYRIAAPVR